MVKSFTCDFCCHTGFGLGLKYLPTSGLHICQVCVNDLTIARADLALRNFYPTIYYKTIREIYDDQYYQRAIKKVQGIGH